MDDDDDATANCFLQIAKGQINVAFVREARQRNIVP